MHEDLTSHPLELGLKRQLLSDGTVLTHGQLSRRLVDTPAGNVHRAQLTCVGSPRR